MSCGYGLECVLHSCLEAKHSHGSANGPVSHTLRPSVCVRLSLQELGSSPTGCSGDDTTLFRMICPPVLVVLQPGSCD